MLLRLPPKLAQLWRKLAREKLEKQQKFVNEKASFSCLSLWKLLAAYIKEPSHKSS